MRSRGERGGRVLAACAGPGGEAVTSALTACDADTQSVADPSAALAALTAEHHDALVLEIDPVRHDDTAALAIARTIRADPELHGTPICGRPSSRSGSARPS